MNTIAKSALLWLVVIASVAPVTSVHAGKDGDGVPTPNDFINQYTELADKERYDLVGRVEMREIRGAARGIKYPALVIDLKQHPWLGGVRRSKDPVYRIQGTVGQWTQLEGKDVRVKVIAHGAIQQLQKNTAPQYVMSLEVLKVDLL